MKSEYHQGKDNYVDVNKNNDKGSRFSPGTRPLGRFTFPSTAAIFVGTVLLLNTAAIVFRTGFGCKGSLRSMALEKNEYKIDNSLEVEERGIIPTDITEVDLKTEKNEETMHTELIDNSLSLDVEEEQGIIPTDIAEARGDGSKKAESSIPQVLWQTAKSHNAPADVAKIMSTWSSLNPKLDQRLLDDFEVLSFMIHHFNSSVAKAFHDLPLPVMRADFFRLAVMYHEGGIYADVDVSTNVSIHDWQHDDYGPVMDSCAVVIGMENKAHVSNWGFASVKEHILFQKAIELSLSKFLEYGVDITNEHFVHVTTGPGVLTDAVKYLAEKAGCEWDDDGNFAHALGLYDSCRVTMKEKYNICYVDEVTQNKWFQNHYASQKSNLQSEDFVGSWTKARDKLVKGRSSEKEISPVKPDGGGVPLFTTDPDCSSWQFSKQWKDLGYNTQCMDNTKVKQMVASYCEHRPREIIQYADIARLLILYENGGWYVDSDVRPTPRCGFLQSFPQTTFGLESDFATKTQAKDYGMLQQSLSLWAIYGVKGDKRLLQNACILSSLAEQKQKKPGESQHGYILRTTGPTIQTQLWNGTVLPISVFGCGQAHSGSPPCSASSCWGCHEFKGIWIQDKELARYSNLLANSDMNINSKFYSLSAMISTWSKMFSGDDKKIRLATDVLYLPLDVDIVELPKSDDSTGIQLIFKKGSGMRSAYNNNVTDDKNKKKETEETIKEGGIQVMINKTPDGDLEVIAKRCEIEEETIVKKMSEKTIINSLGEAISTWKKENENGFGGQNLKQREED